MTEPIYPKPCSKCGEMFPREEYHVKSRKTGQRVADCRKCRSLRRMALLKRTKPEHRFQKQKKGERPNFPGVYAIIHLPTGRRYIGAGWNIDARWRLHKSQMKRGVHPNPRLQAAFDDGGEDAMAYVVLEQCPPGREGLDIREQHWLDSVSVFPGMLLNRSRFVESNKGCPTAPETKAKLREQKLGNQYGKDRHYHGVLTESDIVAICEEYAAGGRTVDIATRFNVTRTNVTRIVKRKIWWNVPLDPEVERRCLTRDGRKDHKPIE